MPTTLFIGNLRERVLPSIRDYCRRYMGISDQTNFDGAKTFRVMQEAFEQARQRNPDSCSESFYVFAGKIGRIRIVGRELAKYLLRPFSHLQIDQPVSDAPELKIDLWDERETEISREGGSPSYEFAPNREVKVSLDRRVVRHQVFHTTTLFDRETQHITGCMTGSERLSLYELGRPLHFPLLLWLNDRGGQAMHTGLVSRNGQGVLLGGAGGAGKSTSALTCLSAGFRYLSDDYVGLELLRKDLFLGHSFYCSAHLEPDHLARFPFLQSYGIRGKLPQEDKILFLLSQVFPERLERCVPIRVIVLPRIVDIAKSQWQPATKGEALLRIAPSSLVLLPRVGMRGFNKIAQLVEHVPCYWLDLGRDLDSIPRCVEELLGAAAHPEVCSDSPQRSPL